MLSLELPTLLTNGIIFGIIILVMNRRQQRTRQHILARTTPAGIRWADIESLLRALGVEMYERAGSRVHLVKGTETIVVHRPHPRPETNRETVRDIAGFLERIGGTD